MDEKDITETERHMALDKIADNLTDALRAASVGAEKATAHHIGQAAADIIDLSNIVHTSEE